MRCEGNGRPCSEESLTTQPLCPYHWKLAQGLLADSTGRYHAAPAGRPEHQVVLEDGWVSIVGGQDPITQLLQADARRELESHADLGFLR